MNVYDFVLIVDGLDLTNDEDLDRLFDAGLDDATLSVADTVQYIDVTREAGWSGQALSAALREARVAGANRAPCPGGGPERRITTWTRVARGQSPDARGGLASTSGCSLPGSAGQATSHPLIATRLQRCTHGLTSSSG